MKSIIVGTAGHIDHGKTALVKALTGIDADRLEEEKRRGITIDLGFAHLELNDGSHERLRVGFVDVPGHERFVRNMLAGIGGIDLVLLVIAADESIKPQTREHFDICRLLSVRRGIVALTKADLVDSDTLSVARAEIEDFVRGSFLESAPVIPVSALTGTGIDDLKIALSLAARDVANRDFKAPARLPVDRVFTMKGFGTVVTGTLISGAIRKEDEVEIFPQQRRVRVRGVQVHGQIAEAAVAGERTALNLAGIEKEDLKRGSQLAQAGLFSPTTVIDVSLSLLPSATLLKNRAHVHFHAHTFEAMAEVALFEAKCLDPGETAFARLRLTEPATLLPGDRFIIRQFSPVVTIGGGVVLDAAPLFSRSVKYSVVPFLEKLKDGSPREIIFARISRREFHGLSLEAAVSETGWSHERLEAAISDCQSGIVHAGDRLISSTAFNKLAEKTVSAVTNFQTSNPLSQGIGREVLRKQLRTNPEIFSTVLNQLIQKNQLQSNGDQVQLPGRGVVLKDEEAESRLTIERAFASAGLKVPPLKDVLEGLKIDRARAQKIVTLLLRDKILVKTSEDLVFHRDALASLRQKLAVEKGRSPKIDVARFKDLTGVSRKFAIPLLEYLDREHITKRVGNERIIL
jgi:selenocysteine-specific elongation factor